MPRTSPIDHVVFDFDGTCTDVPSITPGFFRSYREELNRVYFHDAPLDDADWQSALDTVRAAAPDAGWTIATTPSAPAAADPYIQAFEALEVLRRRRGRKDPVPGNVFDSAYRANAAPLRPEVKSVLEFLRDRDVRATFISNSSPDKIQPKIEALFDGAMPAFVRIQPDGRKFNIGEPRIGDPAFSDAFLALFRTLPATVTIGDFARPVYLRRADYAGAISAALDGDVSALSRTLFCGDIWEMDLAMPFYLGASIHLVTRAAPFVTYPYEFAQVARATERARSSATLEGLRDWF